VEALDNVDFRARHGDKGARLMLAILELAFFVGRER
jgi:hypothetical protein